MSMIELQLPQYETTLPITGTKVKYRPFMVREQKVLILALEADDIPAIVNAIRQIVSNCTFGKVMLDELPRTDAEYLFVQLRNKSMGEVVEAMGKCSNKECKHLTEVALNFEEATVLDKDSGKETIQLDTELWVEMVAPSLVVSYAAAQEETAPEYVTAMCIKTIIQGENTINCEEFTDAERIDFVDKLTVLQAGKVNKFFDVLPRLVLESGFVCEKCGTTTTIKLEGLEDFFM